MTHNDVFANANIYYDSFYKFCHKVYYIFSFVLDIAIYIYLILFEVCAFIFGNIIYVCFIIAYKLLYCGFIFATYMHTLYSYCRDSFKQMFNKRNNIIEEYVAQLSKRTYEVIKLNNEIALLNKEISGLKTKNISEHVSMQNIIIKLNNDIFIANKKLEDSNADKQIIINELAHVKQLNKKDNAYNIFGLSENATMEQIDKIYVRLLSIYNPNEKLVEDSTHYNKIKNAYRDLILSNECCVCFETINKKIALIPCGHTKICKKCKESINKCPICRVNITSYVDIY